MLTGPRSRAVRWIARLVVRIGVGGEQRGPLAGVALYHHGAELQVHRVLVDVLHPAVGERKRYEASAPTRCRIVSMIGP
jgi:hypothetical protein